MNDNATTWTVIGVWQESQAIPTGVIAGSHEVSGGDGVRFPQGCWATSVTAPDAETAEAAAVAEMEANDTDDGEDDPVRSGLAAAPLPFYYFGDGPEPDEQDGTLIKRVQGYGLEEFRLIGAAGQLHATLTGRTEPQVWTIPCTEPRGETNR